MWGVELRGVLFGSATTWRPIDADAVFGMRAVRDAETASASIGLDVVAIRALASTLSAVLTGIAGGASARLTHFVAPSAFPFLQSILFLLVVIIGGAGTVAGPLIGAAIVVLMPEYLGFLAEYRLLFFGALLLVVLWLTPEGVVGAVPRRLKRPASVPARAAAPAGAAVR